MALGIEMTYRLHEGVMVKTSALALFNYLNAHMQNNGEFYLSDEDGNWLIVTKEHIISSEVSSPAAKMITDEGGYVHHRFEVEIGPEQQITVVVPAHYRAVRDSGLYVYLPSKEEAALFEVTK